MHKQQHYLDAIGETIALLGNDDFYSAISNVFCQNAEVGHVLILQFPSQSGPICLYSNCTNEEDYNREVNGYINGPYIFDPYYQASLSGVPDGAYRLKDIAPDDFKKTEFFRHYYKATNINDELSYLAALPNHEHIHVSLSRPQTDKKFTASSLKLFNSICPVVINLLKQHWAITTIRRQEIKSSSPNSETLSFNKTLQQALKNFGRLLLTPREHDVLQLILHGHSNKAVAQRLEISLATVKLHRKRIYQKLDIGSQAELFYLFIDALSSTSAGASGDPLEVYMGLNSKV